MYIRKHVCIIRMYVRMYVCMHVRMYAYMHVCMYVCMYVCMHVCMYVCMYVCIYMYILCVTIGYGKTIVKRKNDKAKAHLEEVPGASRAYAAATPTQALAFCRAPISTYCLSSALHFKNRTKQKPLVTFIHHTDIPGATLEVQDPIVAPATMAFAERVGVSAAVQTQRRLLLICCCWQVHALRSPRDIPNIGVGLSIGS